MLHESLIYAQVNDMLGLILLL